MNQLFRKFAETVSVIVGTPWAFIMAVAMIVIWGAIGPLFGFSQQWQLVINSFTTIVTFLMVFLIQNTQNRDFKALHLKLDGLIHADEEAHPHLMNLQDLPDEELDRWEQELRRAREQRIGKAREQLMGEGSCRARNAVFYQP
jgi:low affinity Fe/Cu permease